jgi:hypothetical protein
MSSEGGSRLIPKQGIFEPWVATYPWSEPPGKPTRSPDDENSYHFLKTWEFDRMVELLPLEGIPAALCCSEIAARTLWMQQLAYCAWPEKRFKEYDGSTPFLNGPRFYDMVDGKFQPLRNPEKEPHRITWAMSARMTLSTMIEYVRHGTVIRSMKGKGRLDETYPLTVAQMNVQDDNTADRFARSVQHSLLNILRMADPDIWAYYVPEYSRLLWDGEIFRAPWILPSMKKAWIPKPLGELVTGGPEWPEHYREERPRRLKSRVTKGNHGRTEDGPTEPRILSIEEALGVHQGSEQTPNAVASAPTKGGGSRRWKSGKGRSDDESGARGGADSGMGLAVAAMERALGAWMDLGERHESESSS